MVLEHDVIKRLIFSWLYRIKAWNEVMKVAKLEHIEQFSMFFLRL